MNIEKYKNSDKTLKFLKIRVVSRIYLYNQKKFTFSVYLPDSDNSNHLLD